eukprot:jgi/Hompol1/5840/HPOL_004747-RA
MGPSIGFSIDQTDTPSSIQGNNGGDALVASRFLHQFGFKPWIYYPKQPKRDLYDRLVKQATAFGIPFISSDAEFAQILDTHAHVVLDGIFGFSFSGDVRPPFDTVIKALKSTSVPIVSIDIPSGWDVEKGNQNNAGFHPDMLVSLTIPKLGVKNVSFKHHWLGGRFVPPSLAEKLGLDISVFPNTDLVVELPAHL